MSIPVLSLCSLVAAILISGYSGINLGIICVGFAFIIGHFLAGINMAQIYTNGFPLSLFFLLLGTTLFSSIAKQNGTYHVLSGQLAFLSHGNRRLACLIIFVFSFIFSFFGMGTIVTPAIMMPLLLQMGKEEEIPEVLTILLTIAGCIAGGLSIFAPTGVIGHALGSEIGAVSYWPIYIAAFLTSVLHAVIIFFLFGGHKLKNLERRPYEPMVLRGSQFFTIMVAFCVIVSIFGFHLDLGLSAFFGAAILLICKAADQDKAIKGISWSIMLLLCGVSMLLYVITASGGIAAVENFIEGNMSVGAAGGLTAVLAGAMSFVSSSSVVVMPTVIPMIPDFLKVVGGEVSPLFLTAAVIISAHAVPYCPFSTMGAIGLAVSAETGQHKLFVKMVLAALCMYMVTTLLFFAGAYNILNNF